MHLRASFPGTWVRLSPLLASSFNVPHFGGPRSGRLLAAAVIVTLLGSNPAAAQTPGSTGSTWPQSASSHVTSGAAGSWDGRFISPVDPELILDMVVDERGHVYVTGRFDQISGVLARSIAGWDGTRWYALTDELRSPPPIAAARGGEIVFARADDSGAEVMKWDGKQASALGTDLSAVESIAVGAEGDIYASGCKPVYRGDPTGPGVVRLDGGSWRRLHGAPDCTRFMQYASGHLFAAWGGTLYRWIDSTALWERVVEHTVSGNSAHLHVMGPDHVFDIRTWFEHGTLFEELYEWRGGDWTRVQLPVDPLETGRMHTGLDGRLLVPARLEDGWVVMAMEDGQWKVLTPPTSEIFRVASGADGGIYATGKIGLAGGEIVRIARWDGESWQAVTRRGQGAAVSVSALVRDRNDDMFVLLDRYGRDRQIGDDQATLARWSGTGWKRIDPPSGYVSSIAAGRASDLFANIHEGPLNQTNTVTYRWRDDTWSAIAPLQCPNGSDEARDLYVIDADLQGRVYGFFSCDAFRGLARWDGQTWEILGEFEAPPQQISSVYAIALDNEGGLYVGGRFTRAGGADASAIAYWDGSNWSSVGGGLHVTHDFSASVYAMVWDRGQLYVGGIIERAGSQPASGVLQWDGSQWSSLGGGGPVRALAIDENGLLYAGGDFTSLGYAYYDRIARWNGRNWDSLGDGIQGRVVHHLQFDSSGSLWVAGDFFGAGGSGASNIAIWHPDPDEEIARPHPVEMLVFPNPARDVAHIQLSVDAPGVYTAVLYDVLGRHVQTVFTRDLADLVRHSFTLDMSGLTAGIYYLHVRGDGVQFTRPVLRVR
jgi:trimeric autotransporter adhesin